jgi:hypothetical protein
LNRAWFGHGLQGFQRIQKNAPLAFHVARFPEHAAPAELDPQRNGAVEGEEQFRWLRQLIEAQSDISDPREFLSNLKVDLYPDEVYCFTPKGEVITLPRDATPVDFGLPFTRVAITRGGQSKFPDRSVKIQT